MDLVDLTVKGYDPFEGWDEDGNPIGGAMGEVNVQTLTDRGFTDASYVWNDFTLDPDEEDGDPIVYKGWYDDAENLAERGDRVLSAGEGFVINTQDTGVQFSVQSSGEVLTAGDLPVVLRANNTYIANPTPVTVDLKDCYVIGYDPFEGWDEDGNPIGGAMGEVNAQKLTDRGFTAESYVWNDFTLDPEEEDGDPIVYRGWYDDAEEQPGAGVCSVAAGEGYVINTQDTGVTFKFVWPKVDIK